MLDLRSQLNALKRPSLLVRAARSQTSNYSRHHHLARVLGYGKHPKPGAAILQLLDLEQELNQQRLTKDAGYLISRHVDILIAIVGEAEIYFKGCEKPAPYLPPENHGAMTDPAIAPSLSP